MAEDNRTSRLIDNNANEIYKLKLSYIKLESRISVLEREQESHERRIEGRAMLWFVAVGVIVSGLIGLVQIAIGFF